MTMNRARAPWIPALYTLMMLFGAACAQNSTANSSKSDPTDSADLDRIFARSTLQIATPSARLHTFNIWIAEDDPHRARGLMFIKHLGADDGMLFVYPTAQPIAMWMKNTYVPLDMLFVAANGKVARVVERTEPLSLKTIESGGPVLGVIELPAGTAARLNITVGAQVIHPAFASAKP